MKNKIAVFIFIFLCIFISDAVSDTIHLKNGRSIKGLIKKENESGIWLDLGIGEVKFGRREIDKIDRSSIEEIDQIRKEWRKKNVPVEKETKPKEVEFFRKGEHIFVNALLNNKVKARLIVDTGAPSVLVSEPITKKLGIKTQGLKTRTIAVGGMPDLQVVDTVLDSIKIEGIEARDIDAELLLDEISQLDADGLLGMSFLKKFKFQIDSVNKKLILEEKKSQDILEKTKYFSVVIPSDWESWIDEETLTIAGPNLLIKEGGRKPRIAIKKYTEEKALGYFEAVKRYYDHFKNSPDLKHEMSKQLKDSYERSSSQGEHESAYFDFEEKKNIIMLHEVFIYKENNASMKSYSVNVITKDGPLRAYNLTFICIGEYFDKFLPVFKRCLESFIINE